MDILTIVALMVVAGLIVYLWNEKRRERVLGNAGGTITNWIRGYRARNTCAAGDGYLRKQQYQEALGRYSRAIELDPRLPVAYNNRGFVHWNLNDYERAIVDYCRAIEVKPNYGMAYSNRAFAHKALGHKEAAIADFEKVLELTGDARLITQAKEQLAELKGETFSS